MSGVRTNSGSANEFMMAVGRMLADAQEWTWKFVNEAMEKRWISTATA